MSTSIFIQYSVSISNTILPQHHAREKDKEKDEDIAHAHHIDKSPKTIPTHPDDHSVHKIVHKFDLDPFEIKIDMNIKCRIYDERDKSTKHTSHTPHFASISKEESKPVDPKSKAKEALKHDDKNSLTDAFGTLSELDSDSEFDDSEGASKKVITDQYFLMG